MQEITIREKLVNIPILLGTARTGRQTEKAAKYILSRAIKYGFHSELVDVKDHMLPRTIPSWQDPKPSKSWAEIIKKTDGLIIVSPEYNHSFPGELKIVLDSLKDEYIGIPVAICATSNGGFGGARMIEQLWSVIIALHMVPTGSYVNFSYVQDQFNEDGSIKDKDFDRKVEKMLNELNSYI